MVKQNCLGENSPPALIHSQVVKNNCYRYYHFCFLIVVVVVATIPDVAIVVILLYGSFTNGCFHFCLFFLLLLKQPLLF